MKLKKCSYCNIYTLDDACKKCGRQTVSAHYKFVKIGVPKKEGISENNLQKEI